MNMWFLTIYSFVIQVIGTLTNFELSDSNLTVIKI